MYSTLENTAWKDPGHEFSLKANCSVCEPWRPSKIAIVFFQSLTSGVTFPLEMAFSCRLLFSERLFLSSEPWKTQQYSLFNFSELIILALNIRCTPPSETHPLGPYLGWPHILVGPGQLYTCHHEYCLLPFSKVAQGEKYTKLYSTHKLSRWHYSLSIWNLKHSVCNI